MSTPIEQMKNTLKSHGHSVTKPRQELFSTLQKQESMTMHELIARCPVVDRATLYRNIELFESLGIVHRIQIGWKYRIELADSFVHHHHHMSCTVCGRVIDLAEDAELESRLLELADGHGFTTSDHQLEIRGVCANCR